MDDARSKLIEDALAAGRVDEAARWASEALGAGIVTPLLLNLAAWRCEERGDFEQARSLLHMALEMAPGDAAILTALGTISRKEGRLDEAIEMFGDVIARNPCYAVPWLERGFALEAVGAFALAVENYGEACSLDRTLAPAFAGLAWIAAIRGEHQAVLYHAREALQIEPGNITATLAIARSELEQGEVERAIERLEPLPARADVDHAKRGIALGMLGTAYDMTGASDRAFAAYREANRLFRETPSPLTRSKGQPATHRDFVERISAWVARQSPKVHGSALVASGPASGHVFVLGYPRSGNTLVETILASAKDVETLQEKPTLRDADEMFLLESNGLDRLGQIDAATTAMLRSAYWAMVRAAGIDVAGKTFIDMDPLKSIKLPLIATLFPEARIVIMRRDPRDVVWSCFRTGFALTAATLEFTDLERAARHYDSVMRLIDRCRERWTLNVQVIRHDQLVADFDTVVSSLCDFTGIAWSPDMRAFDQTARKRGVSTASASQVRRGLFDGNGQWRRHEAEFRAINPILAPWVKRFGYLP